MSASKIFLPVICGPTASGKSGLAIALAKRLNGEVVSADSMQIYAELRVGTARVTEEETEGVPHHLVGFLPLSEPYSVARYVADAHTVIADIVSRGKTPILCGGTGLYISSLIGNLQFSDQPDTAAVRAKWQTKYRELGGETMLRELAGIDPETAARLHPNDAGRIIRAFEIYETTGVTMAEQRRRSTEQPSPYRAFSVMLDAGDRAYLYSRINARVDAMMQNGLLEEAKALYGTPYAPTAMQAIGYKELFPALAGEIPLDRAVENIKQGTRRYAKRQLSWFRRMADATLLIDRFPSLSAMTDEVMRLLPND